LKLTCNLGAYGWQHKHWAGTYYPEDLPADWQLNYYSNDFRTVLVPVDYWQTITPEDCYEWLDAVDDEFQFFAEVSDEMFSAELMASTSAMLEQLSPQLSALVFLGHELQLMPEAKTLLQRLGITIYAADTRLLSAEGLNVMPLWQQADPCVSDLALIKDNLKDLRLSREQFEKFIQSYSLSPTGDEVNLFVTHPQLQAHDLSKFRSVLELMGY